MAEATSIGFVLFATSALFLSAYAAAFVLVGPTPVLLRWTAVIAAVVWLQTAAFHLLAMTGLFVRPAAALVLAGFALVAWRTIGGRQELTRLVGRDRSFLFRVARLFTRSRSRTLALTLLGLTLPALVRCLLMPPMGWDSLTYHALKPATWVQSGGVDTMAGPGPWAYYRNMLAGGEVFWAWPMLALHSDALTGVVEVLQYLGLGFVVMVLARRLGVREPLASALAVFVLSLPAARLLVGSGYVEIGLLLALACGLTLGFTRGQAHARLAPLAAGVLGVCAATKLTMIPVAGLLLLLLISKVAWSRADGSSRRAFAVLLAFSVALLPWPILAYSRTGFPLSPHAVLLGPLELGRSLPETDWWIETTTRLAADSANEWRVVRQVFQSPLRPGEAIGALALLPLAFAPLGFGVLVRQTPAAGMAVGISATFCIAAYSSPAFAPVRHAWTVSSSRFLLPAAMLGIVLGGVWLSRSRKTAVLSAGVLAGFAVVNLGWQCVVGASTVTDIPILGATGIVAALGGLAFLARRIRRVAVRLACVLAVAVTTVAGLGLLRGMLRNEFLRHEQVIHPMPRYWVEAVPLTDHPVTARKIAVTSGPHFALDNWFAYPFVGRALQNELIYVPISRDGRVHHFGSGQLAADLTATADYERWYERLVTLGVTDVMSFRPASLELEWMQEHPQHFEFVVGSRGDWGLFRVRDTRSVENDPPA